LLALRELERARCLAERHAPVEARAVADVAARAAARDLDPEPDAVLIVVDQELLDLLHEPARRALVPDGLAAAAPVMRLAGLDRLRERFGVHVRVHEDVARRGVRR